MEFGGVYWTPRAKRAGSYQTFTTSNRCTQKCHRKPPLLRGEQSEPWKATPSLKSFPHYIPLAGAPKSATENHHFWEASKASPEKQLPLSWAKREKFPSLHNPYWCTQKCHRKPALFRGEQSEPWKESPSLLSKAREVSLTSYPLLVHSKLPQKTTTFERRA